MKFPSVPLLTCLGLLIASTAGAAPAPDSPPETERTIAQHVRTFEPLPGFLPLYWDAKKGELWLEISEFDADLLYVVSLPAGLGSNDVGLDRGQLGTERIVRFTRIGPKVLLVQPNLAFRATSREAAERTAVAESFASSVLAGFEVSAEQEGRVLVNATEFFLRDAHQAAARLKQTKQGTFKLDAKRSAFYLPRTKNFPRNTEVEVTLTFGSDDPGEFVRDVVPDPRSVTLRQRHSFVRLPEPGYVPRAFDPRAGYSPVSFADYSAPLDQPLVKRVITRHRLEKKNPAAARSEPVKPIVYYLDAGTPEPVRSALLDGARWWAEAFEAAGFVNAYRVELLPVDADPMDVRYNVIQWVHRATRGWSYGSSVIDPRTGEIIKGHVTLGSLRVRHDYLIAEGLLAPHATGRPASPEMERMALARLRQLSAHEVGHTLGLAHNFLASTAGRASVMDYPHPFVRIRNDRTLALDEAYVEGIGEWDKVTIAAGYVPFAPGRDELAEIDALLRGARERGLSFLSDQDARTPGGAHPTAHLWDNGTSAVDELTRMLEVRAIALERFGENVIRPGQPLATLEDALVPVYLSHRYQVEATVKLVGGQAYAYALRGDGQTALAMVPAGEQRRALAALLGAVAPDTLRLPDALLQLLPPRPMGFRVSRENFKRRTGLTFDVLAPGEAAAGLTFSVLFNPQRASRLAQQQARDPELPSLDEVVTQVLDATWRRPVEPGYDGEIRRVVAHVALSRLFTLAADAEAAMQARAVVTQHLVTLREWLTSQAAPATHDAGQRAHLAFGARLIEQFLEDPAEFAPPRVPPPPPGQPIGSLCDFIP